MWHESEALMDNGVCNSNSIDRLHIDIFEGELWFVLLDMNDSQHSIIYVMSFIVYLISILKWILTLN